MATVSLDLDGCSVEVEDLWILEAFDAVLEGFGSYPIGYAHGLLLTLTSVFVSRYLACSTILYNVAGTDVSPLGSDPMTKRKILPISTRQGVIQ